MSEPLFTAQIDNGILFKTPIDVMYGVFNLLVLNLSDAGIGSRMMNTRSTMLFDLFLRAENITNFKIQRPMIFGINVSHLREILSPTKKDDKVILEIRAEEPDKLYIKIIPKNKQGHVNTGFVAINNIQIVEIELPQGYEIHLSGCIQVFSKMWKNLGAISKVVRIYGNSSKITFQSSVDGMLGKGVDFYNADKLASDLIEFDQSYNKDDLLHLSKLSNLGKTVEMYVHKDLPFKITTNIGNIGDMSIYIQNKDIGCGSAAPGSDVA